MATPTSKEDYSRWQTELETYLSMLCTFCETDEATKRHHRVPRQRNKQNPELIDCCYDCADQVHMLFNEKELAQMTLLELVEQPQMQHYLTWKQKHPGQHRHRMSRRGREWRKYHR